MGRYSMGERSDIRKVLRQACVRKELLILATPFLQFDSRFLSLSKDELLVAGDMGEEEATFGLRAPDLRIRFPYGIGFLEAQVRFLGTGSWKQAKVVRLTIPEAMQDDDHRMAYRVDRVGEVQVACALPDGLEQVGRLRNISTTGLRVELADPSTSAHLKLGQVLSFSIPLTEAIRFQQPGRIRYIQGEKLGVEFTPPLEGERLQELSRWVFVHQEEDQVRVAEQAQQGTEGALLLVSPDAACQATLAGMLQGLPPIQRVNPTLEALQGGLAESPSLLFLHVSGERLEQVPALRRMAAFLAGHWPFILLGSALDNEVLFELATELRATSSFMLTTHSGSFFHRLVSGVLRRYEGGLRS